MLAVWSSRRKMACFMARSWGSEGSTAAELVNDFHGAVDDYLALCEENHTEPERAYKGSFNVRISPELHKQAVIFAMAHNMSLNSLVENSIEQAVHAG